MPQTSTTLSVAKLNFKVLSIPIAGTVPLIINRFSEKAKQEMRDKQKAGDSSKAKKNREPKDFLAMGNAARHISTEGWDGIHAGAFRNACISACRTIGVVMTRAKLCIFVEHDGFDVEDGVPLVRIHGDMKLQEAHVRLKTGVPDLRMRPHYFPWTATLRVRFDNDMMNATDVVYLVSRVGLQVVIGEGRPDSKYSCGTGNGMFQVDPTRKMGIEDYPLQFNFTTLED